MLAAHHPVEVLHPQLLAPRGERGELLDTAQVVPVGPHLQRNPETTCRVTQRQEHPVVARLHHDQPLGPMRRHVDGQRLSQA